MSKIHFDVIVSNGVAIDVANELLLFCWMDGIPF